jgi:hypothetical protein
MDFENALATIRGSTLSCNLQIPTPPAGQTLNYNQVNVIYTPSGGQPLELVYNSGCTGNGDGWHYDNPSAPTRIELCQNSCNTIQADKGAKLDIALGCATAGGVH